MAFSFYAGEMRIAIIGADGQLGSELVKTFQQDEVQPLFYPEFDITQARKARETLQHLQPDTVINTAAYHRVDDCEDNPQQSFLVNSVAVRDLAIAARELGFVLVHFSTDYVFDGRKRSPYVEDDPPHPLNVYAVSKLAGEFFVRALVEKYFLIRTCGLYGEAKSPERGFNFIDRVISWDREGKPLRIVNDQWVTPTASAELAEKISQLIRTSHFGLYHLTNEGECTWYQFAREIFSLLGKEPRLEGVDSRTFGAKARRPLYSVLDNKRARDIGLRPFSPWREALSSYLKKKGYLT